LTYEALPLMVLPYPPSLGATLYESMGSRIEVFLFKLPQKVVEGVELHSVNTETDFDITS